MGSNKGVIMSQTNMPTGARRFGYFVTVIINFALLYVANNLLEWKLLPFLTEDFNECLWAIRLSFAVTIFINFIFMFFDRKWFKSLMESVNSVFSFISGYIFYRVFPLDLPGAWERWVNLGLVILLVMIALSVLVQMMNAVKYYRRNPDK